MGRLASGTLMVDGNADIVVRSNSRKGQPNRLTVWVFGDFGSGTVTFQSSPNNGTDFMDIKDGNGDTVALTADGSHNIELYCGDNSTIEEQAVKLRLALAGSTNPDIEYIVNDVQ